LIDAHNTLLAARMIFTYINDVWTFRTQDYS